MISHDLAWSRMSHTELRSLACTHARSQARAEEHRSWLAGCHPPPPPLGVGKSIVFFEDYARRQEAPENIFGSPALAGRGTSSHALTQLRTHARTQLRSLARTARTARTSRTARARAQGLKGRVPGWGGLRTHPPNLRYTYIYIYILAGARVLHTRSKLDLSTEALKDSLNSHDHRGFQGLCELGFPIEKKDPYSRLHY